MASGDDQVESFDRLSSRSGGDGRSWDGEWDDVGGNRLLTASGIAILMTWKDLSGDVTSSVYDVDDWVR